MPKPNSKKKKLGLGTQWPKSSGFPKKDEDTRHQDTQIGYVYVVDTSNNQGKHHPPHLRPPREEDRSPTTTTPNLFTIPHLTWSRNSAAVSRRGVHCTRYTPTGTCVPSTSYYLGTSETGPMVAHQNA